MSPPSSSQELQASRELVRLALQYVEMARRVITMLNLPVDDVTMAWANDLNDTHAALQSALDVRFNGEQLYEPATPRQYRYHGG